MVPIFNIGASGSTYVKPPDEYQPRGCTVAERSSHAEPRADGSSARHCWRQISSSRKGKPWLFTPTNGIATVALVAVFLPCRYRDSCPRRVLQAQPTHIRLFSLKEDALSAERLQKVLASAGIASRRDCEELISAGRVSVNGKVVTVAGTRVDAEQDEIAVDGQPIGKIHPRTYVML